MSKQTSAGKFGLEIPALTEARLKAEAESYSPQSRSHYHSAMKKSSELIKQVEAFLEKNGAPAVSACGADHMFGVITSQDDPKAPCGVSFYGSRSLAEAVASAFPKHKVIAAQGGEVVAPAAVVKRGRQKPIHCPNL